MTRKESLKIIDAVFSQIDGPQDGFSTVREILFRLNVESEKRHRRLRSGPWGITVPQAAKLFTVRYLAKGLENPDRWNIDDINAVRLEALKAQAYAKQYRAEFLAAFEAAGVTLAEVLALDYAALMGVEA